MLPNNIYNPKCTKCDLHKTRKHVVSGKGNFNVKIIGLGEAPGPDENLKGTCFVGAAGKHLDDILKYAGLNYSPEVGNIWLDNPVKCFPFDDMGRSREPSNIEIKACRSYLIQLIRCITPKLIICFGSTATNVMIGLIYDFTENIIKAERGKLFYWHKIAILPLYHPSMFIYKPTKAKDTFKHLDANKELIERFK